MGGKARRTALSQGIVRTLDIVARIPDALGFAAESQVLLLRHTASGVDVDKAVAWRPQDQLDVERLLALHGRGMDFDRVRRYVAELGEALEVDRLSDLDQLIQQV